MIETWFAIFWVMVAVYVVLDGRTLGAGAMRLVLASNADERRQVLDAIGPLWTWYEVWLVGAGGVLMLAFPAALAVGFSGYYLALMLVLWLLIIRGMAIELGRHVTHPLWNSFWDFMLSASCVLLLLLFGVSLGNMLRGVPLDSNGEFHMAFFTDFGVRGHVGLLDWYTLSVGAFSLAALLAHGVTHLQHTLTGVLRRRSRIAAAWLWFFTLGLAIVVATETYFVRPDFCAVIFSRPLSLAFLVIAGIGSGFIVYGYRADRSLWSFAGSCTLITGVLAARAAATFPVIFFSTLDPDHPLTAHQVASNRHSLAIGLVWWAIAAPIAVLWHFLASRSFRSKVAAGQVLRNE